MVKKFILIVIVLVLAYAAGVGISYLIKNDNDGSKQTNSSPDQSAQAGADDEDQEQLHQYTIEALRNREYDGGELVIERGLGDQGSFKTYLVSYMSDGFKLYALMNVPDMAKPEGGFPVIILNHGYIEPTVYSTITSYRSYMDAYSRQGFLVLKPDYRGHDDSEGEPVSAHISPDYTVDVLNLIDAVKTYPDANSEKIGMWGHSMGGGITLRALAVSKDIKAAALLAGVVASPERFYSYWQMLQGDPRVPSWIKENAQRTLDEFGTPQQNPDLWHAISPYSYINEFNTPIQIHHGTADPDVPIVFSEELEMALKEANKPVEYFVYQGGDHNLAGAARSPVLSRTYQFYNQHLK